MEQATPPNGPPRRTARNPWKRAGAAVLLVASLGGTYAAATWLALWFSVRVPDVAVPEVVDLPLEEARSRLAQARLRPKVVARRHDRSEPEGKVVEQSPPPHARTKPGRAVRLVVSLGPPLVVMPDLTGGSLGRARIALESAGLRLAQSASVPHPGVAVGRVVAQYPEPGAEVDTGSAASLLVSAGPPPRAYVMPDLRGVPAERARRALERAGFRRVRLRGPAGPGARIVSQRPPPGTRAATDDVVVLQSGTFEWPPEAEERGGGGRTR